MANTMLYELKEYGDKHEMMRYLVSHIVAELESYLESINGRGYFKVDELKELIDEFKDYQNDVLDSYLKQLYEDEKKLNEKTKDIADDFRKYFNL